MTLLAIHPNFELYGSDRSFAQAVAALRADGHEVTVVLPQAGPILSLPAFAGMAVRFEAMWVPRHGQIGLRFLLRGAWRTVAAWTAMARHRMTYINTLIALDYLVASVLAVQPCAIHVREIPRPAELRVFRLLLIASRAMLVFNSAATRAAFRLPEWRLARTRVVHNGADMPVPGGRAGFSGSRPLRVLAIGRFNGWKGQDVLVAALAAMTADEQARIETRIVGSVFGGNTHFREAVVAAVDAAALVARVSIEPFMDDPGEAYRWADVVVVPSTRPEPFGRVAIEAMAHGCAVVASAHGGLTEIVVDGETGRLVPPGDADALAAVLRGYLAAPERVTAQGAAGHARYLARFTTADADRAIVRVIDAIVPPARRARLGAMAA